MSHRFFRVRVRYAEGRRRRTAAEARVGLYFLGNMFEENLDKINMGRPIILPEFQAKFLKKFLLRKVRRFIVLFLEI